MLTRIEIHKARETINENVCVEVSREGFKGEQMVARSLVHLDFDHFRRLTSVIIIRDKDHLIRDRAER